MKFCPNCRNPYFIGINSAMECGKKVNKTDKFVAILILLELTLQCYLVDEVVL